MYPKPNSHVTTGENSEPQQHGPCPRTFAAHKDRVIYLVNRGLQWLAAKYAAMARILNALP